MLSPADVHADYDNLGRATWTKTYASADFTLSAGELRAETQNLYDGLGRVYESRVYEVDPDDGTVGDYLPSKTWYDAARPGREDRHGQRPVPEVRLRRPRTDRWPRTPASTPTKRPTPTPTT